MDAEHTDSKRARAQEVLGGIFDLVGARVLVTGAAGGLGFTMAEVLAECGASVTLADIDAKRIESSTLKLVDRGLAARSFTVDVTDESSVQALFDDVVEQQGGLDVVFANAGIAAVPGFRADGGQTLDTVERSDWDKVLSVNLNGDHVHHARRSGDHETPGVRADRRDRIQRRPSPRADGLLRLRRKQGGRHPHGPPGRAGARATRDPGERDLPRAVLRDTHRRWRHRASDRGDEGGVGDADPARADGRSRGAEGLVVLLASGASSFMTGAAYLVDGGSLVQA